MFLKQTMAMTSLIGSAKTILENIDMSSVNEASGYPMTYVKMHKTGNKVDHAEMHHTHVDFGGESPTTPERVHALVKSSPKHKALVAKGYSIEKFGAHKAPVDYYTHKVKVTKD